MESKNKEMTELYELEVLKNKELSTSIDKEPLQLALIENRCESKNDQLVGRVAGTDHNGTFFFTALFFLPSLIFCGKTKSDHSETKSSLLNLIMFQKKILSVLNFFVKSID